MGIALGLREREKYPMRGAILSTTPVIYNFITLYVWFINSYFLPSNRQISNISTILPQLQAIQYS